MELARASGSRRNSIRVVEEQELVGAAEMHASENPSDEKEDDAVDSSRERDEHTAWPVQTDLARGGREVDGSRGSK